MNIFSRQKIQLWRKQFMRWYQPQRDKIAASAAPHLARLQDRWQSLNTREKYSILTGATLTGLLLFYALIWSPLNTHLADLRTQILREKKTAAWMQAADQTLRALETQDGKISAKQLSQRINLVQEDLRQSPLQ